MNSESEYGTEFQYSHACVIDDIDFQDFTIQSIFAVTSRRSGTVQNRPIPALADQRTFTSTRIAYYGSTASPRHRAGVILGWCCIKGFVGALNRNNSRLQLFSWHLSTFSWGPKVFPGSQNFSPRGKFWRHPSRGCDFAEL